MSLGFRQATFASCPSLPIYPPACLPAGQGILTCAIISSALWTFFCSAAESNSGEISLFSPFSLFLALFHPMSYGSWQWVLEFYDHKSFTSQMDDSNKGRHTHAHTRTTLTWRGVAILSHEHTLLIRNVGHRLLSLASSGLVACTN